MAMAMASTLCKPNISVSVRHGIAIDAKNATPSFIGLRRCAPSLPLRLPKSVNFGVAVKTVAQAKSSTSIAIGESKLEKDELKLWERFNKWLYRNSELEIDMDISRVGFTDEFVSMMEAKFVPAFAAMKDLENGSIANPDEKRMVGHYWLRAPGLAPTPKLTSEVVQTVARVVDFSQNVIAGKTKPPKSSAGRFTTVLCVGIGGSALGPQFVAEALAPANPPLKIRFIDNTDPEGIDKQITQLGAELASTLVVVTSKSGGTPETRNGLLEVQKAFREAGLDFAKQGVAITQEGSLLDKTAAIEGWMARFPMYDWVGGRTSEFSAVGLLPAALQGIDVEEMLTGARLMDEATRIPVLRQNPAALLAMCWYWCSKGVGAKDMVILPYKDSLMLFSRYLQQLIMESIGKKDDLDGKEVLQGLAVYGNKGSTDQHAYVQQLRDGVPNFFATFIEVLRDRKLGNDWELEPGVTCGDYLFGFLQGTRAALYAAGRESITLTLDEVTPRTVGALIALYERAVGYYALLVNINAYHQPGVEAGKKAASDVLALQKRVLSVIKEKCCSEDPVTLNVVELAQLAGAAHQVEMVYKIVMHMAVNGRVDIVSGGDGSPSDLVITIDVCPAEE
eukprot:jgi/Mesvir1/26683/Mv20464-RA.1